jgi:hypothetical protein
MVLMDLTGTIATPFGTVSKKTALIGGVGVGIVGVMLYRSYRNNRASTAAATAGQSEINPATGYPYGSAEDAAAMAAQANYQFPAVGGGGGGGGSTSDTSLVISTNAQWTQAVIQYWEDHDLGDTSILSAALGVYVTGGVATPAQVTLIQQAVAAKGYPPVQGPDGNPPHINTNPPGNTNPPAGNNPPPSQGDPNAGIHDEAHGWFTVNPPGHVYHVDQWINDVRSHPNGNPAFSWELLQGLNGASRVSGNINWKNPSSARTFIHTDTYRVR